jgi:EpsI family protein
MKARYLLLAIVTVAIVASGALAGFVSGRWHENQRPSVPLEQLPLKFGDWQGEDQPLSEKVVKIAEFDGSLLRRYENQRTRAVVHLLLAYGRPGPLAVHTPAICYGGAGFDMSGGTTRWTPDNVPGGGEFFQTTFARSNSPTPEKLQVLWSWNKNGAWMVTDYPRWKFAGGPRIYKLYVSQEYLPRDKATDGAASREFLRDFLPELNKMVGQHP